MARLARLEVMPFVADDFESPTAMICGRSGGSSQLMAGGPISSRRLCNMLLALSGCRKLKSAIELFSMVVADPCRNFLST